MEKSAAQRQSEQQVLAHVEKLVDEERQLLGQGERSAAEHDRLARVQVELDQCWDLLRQRRALREFGKDASEAKLRDAKIVEKYQG
jgi:hypothetical protein